MLGSLEMVRNMELVPENAFDEADFIHFPTFAHKNEGIKVRNT